MQHNISYLLQLQKNKLSSFSLTPQLDTELLLAFVLNVDRVFLYKNPEFILYSDQLNLFESLINRRLRGEPIAYILGKKEFWSQEFFVDANVLIPRPETELLVEKTLEFFQDKKNAKITLADLGTGSGAIALALARENPDWQIIATDNSPAALTVAKKNAQNLKITNVEFYLGNWCDALPNLKFDAIVSNPPYIKNDDPHLLNGDVRFEPKNALVGGDDGLKAYHEIITQAKNKLKTKGILLLEHGFDQREAITNLLEQNKFTQIVSYRDLANLDRVTSGFSVKI